MTPKEAASKIAGFPKRTLRDIDLWCKRVEEVIQEVVDDAENKLMDKLEAKIREARLEERLMCIEELNVFSCGCGNILARAKFKDGKLIDKGLYRIIEERRAKYIEVAVKRLVDEYGEVLRKLADE